MFHAREFFVRRAADALRGRFRRDESGEIFLKLLKFFKQQIVFVVGNDLASLDVIGVVVPANFPGEFGVAFLGSSVIHANMISLAAAESQFNFPKRFTMSSVPEDSPFSPVYHAAQQGDLARVKEFILANPILLRGDKDGRKPLEVAVMYGHVAVAEWLLTQGAEVVALALAPSKEVAVLLHAHGAEINPQTENGWTPLHTATAAGRVELVEWLLAHEATVNVKNSNGWTPLHFAAHENHLAIAKLLLAAGADANVADEDGRTPLHAAVDYKSGPEMVALLLANRAEPDRQDRHGRTPLHLAVLGTKGDAADLLLAQGAATTLKDHRGKTALQWAVIHAKTEIEKSLRRHGARDEAPIAAFTKLELPTALIAIAKNLEQKLRSAGTEARKISLSEWSSLPVDARDLIPDWLPALLADFSLYGGVFELPNFNEREWPAYFFFWGPVDFQQNFFGKTRHCFSDEFIADGFAIISDESDGNVWLASLDDSISSPVYFFDLSGHEKILAADNIAGLMQRMSVSAS